MAKFYRTILIVFTILNWMNSSWALDAVTVGDPTHPGDLPQAIYSAYQAGARNITINPGSYNLPGDKGDKTLVMMDWNDAIIHAAGVTLIFELLKPNPLYLDRCKNVTWDGGKLEFAQPAATQGRVTSISSDSGGKTCDLQLDAGYPSNLDPEKSMFDVVDATTRVLKVGTGDWTPSSCEALHEPGTFRLHYTDNPGFAVNDWLITRTPGGSEMVHFDGCQGCTLKNVTLCNSGFAAIFETGGFGGNHYLGCRIQPGPRPPGATEEQIVSCGADGFHSVGTVHGPDIEDCTFTGVFHDDCIAIHGSYKRVISSSGNALVLKQGGEAVVGEPLRICDMHGFFAEALVTRIEDASDEKVKVTLDKDLHVPIDHSEDLDDKKGTKANNPNHCGKGFKILRCSLGDTRSRGILVKADDGVISDCTIEGCGMSGVSIGPEFWWGEANYCWNVVVSHNTFRNCVKNNGDQATIWVHWDGAIGNQNITIKDNVIDTCYGQYIFRIEGADGVDLSNNRIGNSFTVKSLTPGNVLWLNHVTNVELDGNEVTQQGKYAGPLLQLDSSVSPAEVHGGLLVKK